MIQQHMPSVRTRFGRFIQPCAGVLALLLGACAGPSPSPTLLTLPPTAVAPGAAVAVAPAGTRQILVVRRVNIPEYLESRRVRFRSESSTLEEWPHTYWAERVEIGATRSLVASLRQALPDWTVCEADCPRGPGARLLKVEVMPFDYLRASRTLIGEARISLAEPAAPAGVLRAAHYRYTVPVDTDSPQGQAQAMSELLRQLGSSVATDVKASSDSAR